MNDNNRKPHPQAAVLGGKNLPPKDAAVLGGIDALKRKSKRVLVSKKGDKIETPLTDKGALEICRQLLYNSFAQDLYRKSQRYPLSESQLVWVHKIAIEHLETTALNLQKPIAPQAIEAIAQFISQACENLKRPGMRLIDPENGEIRLYTNHIGKYPERIYVNGSEYGDRYGCILPAGSLIGEPIFKRDRDCPDWVVRLLERFSQNPAAVAKEYGKLTGRCCFCLQRLTDERSVSAGYGATCAKNYGLPWGETDDDIAF